MKKTESASGRQSQSAELRRKAEQLWQKKKKIQALEIPAEKDARAMVHELQVHQIELEMQNQELLDARATADELSIKYMDLFDFAPTGFFLWDEQGKILELNLAGAILLGLERSTAFKKRFGQFVAVEDRPIFADFCKKVMQVKTKQTCEIKLLIDVKPLDVLIEGIAGLYRKGEGTLCRAAVIDITDRKQVDSLTKLMLISQAVLAKTDMESMLQLIVDAADELIGAKFIVSGYNYCEGSFTVGATSLAARDMLKAPEKRIPLGQGVLYVELILKEGIVRLSEQALRRYYKWNLPPGHPPLRGLLGAKLTAFDGRPEGLIVLSDKTRGGEFTADDQIMLAQLANIACMGLRNINARRMAEDHARELAAAKGALEREIAAHVKTEEALRESEVRFRTMADYNYDWEYWIDSDGTSPIYVSPSCRRISGYSAQEFLDNPDLLESIVHPDDSKARAEHVRQTHDNPNPMTLEFRIITKDGQTRWIEHICQSVFGPDGKCLGRRASNRDVTDRKQAEQALSASIIEARNHGEATRGAADTIRHLARFPEENPNPKRSSASGDDLNPIDPRQPAPAPAANVFNLDEAVGRCFRKYELFQDMVECLFDESDSLLEQMRTELNNGDAEELGRAAHRLKGTVVFLGASPAADATMRVEQIGLSGELGNAAEAIDQLQTQLQLLKDALAPHRKSPPKPENK